MNKALMWSGWAMCLVIAVATVMANEHFMRENEKMVEDLENQLRFVNRPLRGAAPEAKLDEIRRERDELLERVAALELELAEADTNAVTVIGEEDAGEAESKKDSDKPERSAARQQMMEVQASAVTEMLYSELFMELGLDGDTEAAVTAALVDRMLSQMDGAEAALKDEDATARDVYLQMEADRLEAYAELRQVLDRETMAAFEEYDANREERLLQKTIAPQIGQFASGLTEENQALVEQVALEEFVHYQNAFYQSDVPFDLPSNADWQIAAMDSMRSRLSETLDEQQMGEVDRWLDLGMRQMEALKKR